MKAFDLELKITQFPLHPDTPAEGMTLERLFEGRSFDLEAAQARLVEVAAAEGLSYGERTHTYNSRLAQELAKWAELQPEGGAIHNALFRAYFVDATNLARPDELVRIAESIGLSASDARDAIETRSMSASVDADWRRATAAGITGVPTFVIEGRGVVGAQPYSVLESFVSRSGVERRRGD